MEISRLAPVQDTLMQADSAAGDVMKSAEAGYGANLSADEISFQSSMASAASAPDSVSEMAQAVFEPLNHIDTEAAALAEYAQSALESQDTLSPSEMVALTVRSQEFMFHSQLMANIANRTADGVSQLFRQQG